MNLNVLVSTLEKVRTLSWQVHLAKSGGESVLFLCTGFREVSEQKPSYDQCLLNILVILTDSNLNERHTAGIQIPYTIRTIIKHQRNPYLTFFDWRLTGPTVKHSYIHLHKIYNCNHT